MEDVATDTENVIPISMGLNSNLIPSEDSTPRNMVPTTNQSVANVICRCARSNEKIVENILRM